MSNDDTTILDALKAIASGQNETSPAVERAISLGLAVKRESAIMPGHRLALTSEGIAKLGHF